MFDYAIGCFSGRGQATGTAPGGAPRPVSGLNDMNIIKREKNDVYHVKFYDLASDPTSSRSYQCPSSG